MEAHSQGMEWVRARIEELDRRVSGNHDTAATVRGELEAEKAKSAVLRSEFAAQREDMGEVKEQLKWVLRGLVGAIITFTGLIITILVAVFGNA